MEWARARTERTHDGRLRLWRPIRPAVPRGTGRRRWSARRSRARLCRCASPVLDRPLIEGPCLFGRAAPAKLARTFDAARRTAGGEVAIVENARDCGGETRRIVSVDDLS